MVTNIPYVSSQVQLFGSYLEYHAAVLPPTASPANFVPAREHTTGRGGRRNSSFEVLPLSKHDLTKTKHDQLPKIVNCCCLN